MEVHLDTLAMLLLNLILNLRLNCFSLNLHHVAISWFAHQYWEGKLLVWTIFYQVHHKGNFSANIKFKSVFFIGNFFLYAYLPCFLLLQ